MNEQEPENMDLDTEHLLEDPKRISWLLTSLQSQHQPLKLSIPESEQAVDSMVVDVCQESSSFLIDATAHEEVHTQIVAGFGFSMYTSLEGVDVRAESITILEALDDKNGKLYRISFPSKLFYIQRRDAFRVSLEGLFTVPITIKYTSIDTKLPPLQALCFLSNISANGCMVSIADETGEVPVACEHLVVLEFELPESNDTMLLSASPRHSRYIKRSSIWLTGFEFRGLSPDMSEYLARFVSRLQILVRQKSLLD